MKISIEKFGFKKVKDFSDKIGADDNDGFYEKVFEELNTTVELTYSGGNVSLYYTNFDDRVKVANRYQVYTQDQFDFLVLNGRVGWMFKIKNND